MRIRPARGAVQLAWCIHHVLECILGPHLPCWLHIRLHLPTASCSPWILVIMHSGHLPTAVLGVWLVILALSTILLAVVVVVVPIVFSSLLPTGTLVPCVRLQSPW